MPGPILPQQVLSTYPRTIQGVFLETILVLLEESTVQCDPILYDNRYRSHLWCHLLEQRKQNVSVITH